MGVKTFRELRAWQAAIALKRAIYKLTDFGLLSKDFKLREQLRDAAVSSASQISEGFGRWNPADFARFVVMARASTIECQNHLEDAVDRRHISEAVRAPHDELAQAALREIGGLLDYLQSPQAEENARRARARRIARRELRTKNKNSEPRTRTPNTNPAPGTRNQER